jgi:hypothetical protein
LLKEFKQKRFKMVGRKKDVLPLVRISSLIPFEYHEIRVKLGLTWRALIARGVRAIEKNQELEEEVAYLTEVNQKLLKMVKEKSVVSDEN